MQYAEAVRMIRLIPILARIEPAMQKLLAFSSTFLAFEPGEVVFREGEPSDAAYVIEDGEVELVLAVGGAEVVIDRYGRRQLFGEAGIFCDRPRTATVRAVGHVKVLKIEGEVFLRAVTGNPEAALAVMRMLSEKLAALTESYRRGPRWPAAPAAFPAPAGGGGRSADEREHP